MLELIQAKQSFLANRSLAYRITNDININDSDFPIIDYLNENIHEQISLEDIAKHFNFHPHYIIELFKKRFDTTPMNFLQSLRLEKAKEYLEFSNYTISEISDYVGWSPPYFSRLFKSKEGVSPTNYREQTRTVVGKHILLEEEFFTSLDKQPEILNEMK